MAAQQEQLFSEVLQACESEQAASCLHLVYHYRAVARYRLGKFSASVQDSRTALTIEESFTPASCCCAAALVALGKPQEAGQLIRRALRLDPGSAEAKAVLRIASESQVKQALQAAAQAHSTQPPTATGGSAAGSPSPPAIPLPTRATAPPSAPPGRLPPKALNPQSGALDPRVFPAALRRLPHIFQPSTDGVNTNLLLLLHGLGDAPKPYAALARRMTLPQTASLALAGPLEVAETNGGRAWFQAFDDDYELIEPSANEERRSSSLAASCSLLCQLIHNLVEAGWQHRHIHLFGFSQGGTAALEVNFQLRGKQRLGGCVSIAGGMLEELLPERQAQIPSQTSPGPGKGSGPVFITHGDRDDVVSRRSIDRTLQVFTCTGTSCRLHRVTGKGHGMIGSEAEMREVMGFWSETLSDRPPGDDVVEIVGDN